jgi:hypothetical protein
MNDGLETVTWVVKHLQLWWPGIALTLWGIAWLIVSSGTLLM